MVFYPLRDRVNEGSQNSSSPTPNFPVVWLVFLLSISLLAMGCTSISAHNPTTNQSPATDTVVQVSPPSAEVQSSGSLQLTATMTGTNHTAVTWSTTVGTISSNGLFQAPAVTTTTQAVVTASQSSTLFGNSASSGGSSASAVSGSASLTIVPQGSVAGLSISAAMPSGTVGLTYSASASATGGAEPYSWSTVSGALPAGLTLDSSSGTISGTPVLPGTYSFQMQVKDSLSHIASSGSSIVVSSNQGGNFDGPAELPRIYLKTAMSDTPTPGVVTHVNAGGDFQAALNNANCGDTIELQSGATFSGLFKVPSKPCDAQHWIIARTSASDSSLPGESARVSPCYAGVSSLPGRPALNCASTTNVLAKILYTQTAGSGPIQFESGANHYRFVGLEITRSVGTGYVGALASAQAGVSADSIIFDRSWLHGTSHDETGEGFALAGITNASVINSYLGDFHCTSKVGSCTDSHAISGGSGSAAAGPYQIVNNFLEASGENVMFGGGAATVSPADIQISQNHFFKPMTWLSGNAGFVGGSGGNPFVVKNHLELKNAQRVLAEDNIFEDTWGGFSQTGFSILLTPKDQWDSITKTNTCPLCQVTDVTIRYSTISHVGAGIQIANVLSDGGGTASAGERYSIHDVVIDDISASKYVGGGGFIEVGNGWNTNVLNSITVNHVTAFPDPVGRILNLYNDTTNPTMWGFTFTNNLVNSTKYPVWNGSGHSISCSYHDVPITSLTACFTSYSFTNNVIAAVPSGYPPSTWPAGNSFPATDAAIQFANYNNGIGGDYQLLPSSPYKGTGTDGKDPGADIAAVQAATTGVY